jgi:hypothetical protein
MPSFSEWGNIYWCSCCSLLHFTYGLVVALERKKTLYLFHKLLIHPGPVSLQEVGRQLNIKLQAIMMTFLWFKLRCPQ